MFDLFLSFEQYLNTQGINLPTWIFWMLFIITIFSFIIVGYKKKIKPMIKDMEEKVSKINEIDDIKATQTKAINNSIKADKELSDELVVINDKIDKVTKMFVDKQIKDMRTTILNFGSGLMNSKEYDKEAYDHVLEVYNDYEKMLKENNMSNGRVTTTMEIIKESYKKQFTKDV